MDNFTIEIMISVMILIGACGATVMVMTAGASRAMQTSAFAGSLSIALLMIFGLRASLGDAPWQEANADAYKTIESYQNYKSIKARTREEMADDGMISNWEAHALLNDIRSISERRKKDATKNRLKQELST